MEDLRPVGHETPSDGGAVEVTTPSAPAPYIRPIPDLSREGRNRRLLPLILLLLLLCCCCGSLLSGFGSSGLLSQDADLRAAFIIRNADCLSCHSDMVGMLSFDSVHPAFSEGSCLSCHTPHGGELTIDSSGSVTTEFKGSTWWDRLLGSVFGKDSWVTNKLGTGSGSLWWWLVGDHPGSLYNRIVSWFEWLPIRIFGGGPNGTGGISVPPWVRPPGGGTVPGGTVSGTIPGGTAGLVMPQDQLCLMCHQGMAGSLHAAFPHAPVVNGQCTSCHDPHASQHGALLHVDPKVLCVSCHGASGDLGFGKMSTHGPFQNLECTACHAVHGSDYAGMLIQPQRPLCLSCHSSIAALTGKSNQHAPFANQPCTSCHDPHSSDYAPLLHQPETQLCYSCHPQIRNEFNQPSHHPIGFNSMGCGTCHDPHASDHGGLLDRPASELCGACHRGLKARFDRAAHFNTPCTRCHVAHGSAWSPMLTAPNPDLCLQCHTQHDEADAAGNRVNRHPVRPHWYDVHSGKRLTCTSTCHDPHGTRNNYLLKPYSWPYDGNCIICHAVVPGWKVGVDY